MLDVKKCPQSRQEQKLHHSITEGKWTSPRGKAHVFYAMNERLKRKDNVFRVHIMEEEVG